MTGDINWMVVVTSLLFLCVGIYIGKHNEMRKQQVAGKTADDIRINSEREAEVKKRELLLQARDEIQELKTAVEREREEARLNNEATERRQSQREVVLDSKEQQLNTKEQWLESIEQKNNIREERLENQESNLKERLAKIESSEKDMQASLERVAGLTGEQARQELFEKVERECGLTLARRVRQVEAEAKEEADCRARRIITMAIQRCASTQVAESTISVVNLPSDEMKGRIIGREGRNIRMLETETGVNLIIDDTPNAVVLSCYDPIRREIARIALEKLVQDGRIHPTRIEEVVEAAKHDVEERIGQEGRRVALEAGLTDLNPELVKCLGRLFFRNSYSQNVLSHSLEVSFLSAHIANELGANAQVAARAGLLHDLGKALEKGGPHALAGAKICEKYGESPEVVHCVEAHHEDVEQRSLEAMIVQAADAISAARPGARREDVATYVNRLEKLEKLASSFKGVEQACAIQAGREVRVFVSPETVDDNQAGLLAIQLARRIEEEMKQYPGQVRVTVVRETRFHRYAY